MNIRATVRKLCDLSWQDLSQIKKWWSRSTSRDGFSLQNFTNPSLQVATACNSVGQTICHVVTEPCVILSSYLVNPEATQPEIRPAYDAIDATIAHQAQRNGITRMLIVVPDNSPSQPDERFIRVIERKVPQSITTGGQLATKIPATQFLN